MSQGIFQNYKFKKIDFKGGSLLTINGYIQDSSSTHSPAILAEKFWHLTNERTEKEMVY